MSERNTFLLDEGWFFHKGSLFSQKVLKKIMKNRQITQAYRKMLPVCLNEMEKSSWESISVPHDWDREGPFLEEFPSGSAGGYAPCGEGWYRYPISKELFKYFKTYKNIFLYFDGLYRNSVIFINFVPVFVHHYGYGPFEIDLSKLNEIPPLPLSSSLYDDYFSGYEILVWVDNRKQPSCRWYSGSGIYRNVYMVFKPEIYIPFGGVQVISEILSLNGKKGEGSAKGQIDIKISVAAKDEVDFHKIECSCVIYDPSGNELMNFVIDQSEEKRNSESPLFLFHTQIKIENIKLWSDVHPNLYQLKVSVYKKDSAPQAQAGDKEEIKFGFRKISFTPKGLFVNETPVTLKGVCLHHDGGAVGAAVPPAVWRRRLLILKEMGCNAIRTSHNIPASEFLDLCDELGFYVIAEAFDKWMIPKPKNAWGGLQFYKEWRSELYNFIVRDRNHASIILWSLGNEVPKVNHPLVARTYIKMYKFTRELDPTRLITVAFSPNDTKNFIKIYKKKKEHILSPYLDVICTNYGERWLSQLHELEPNRAIIVSEAHHWYRNKLDSETHLPSSKKYPHCTDRNPWYDIVENDYCVGQFLWVGIEYLGEVRDPYPYHGRTNAPIGICGFKKPQSGFHESVWKSFPEQPFVHLSVRDDSAPIPLGKVEFDFPKIVCHWNFSHKLKESSPLELEVWTFTNCPIVELQLNNRSLGEKRSKDYPYNRMSWTVPYEEGTLVAIGKNEEGDVVYQTRLQTSYTPSDFLIKTDKETLSADGHDCVHLELLVVDENNVLCPFADVSFTITVKGEGKLLAVDNGDLSDFIEEKAYLGPYVKSYWGKAFAIIQTTKKKGDIVIKISSRGDIHIEKELRLYSQ